MVFPPPFRTSKMFFCLWPPLFLVRSHLFLIPLFLEFIPLFFEWTVLFVDLLSSFSYLWLAVIPKQMIFLLIYLQVSIVAWHYVSMLTWFTLLHLIWCLRDSSYIIWSHHYKKSEYSTMSYFERDHICITFIMEYCYNFSFFFLSVSYCASFIN